MPGITLSKNDIPFWLGGSGSVAVDLSEVALQTPFKPGDAPVVTFGGEGGDRFIFGAKKSFSMEVSTGVQFTLRPIFDDESPEDLEVLEEFGLLPFLETHPTSLILYLDTGATANAALSGDFQYTVLSSTVSLSVGVDVRYQYLRAFEETIPAGSAVKEFLTNVKLPANVTAPLSRGEAIAFEYGGNLSVGAGLSLGYELKGTPSFEIGQLKLAEHYQLSVAAGVKVGGHVSGRFHVEVRAAKDSTPGEQWDDWARVTIRKAKSKKLSIAADVSVQATSEVKGLPETHNEFLGALLGLEPKNWLNVIQTLQRVEKLTDLGAIEKQLDRLAKEFIGEWLGRAFDELPEAFDTFLAKVKNVVDSYHSLENTAITLFDRYFDRLDVLTGKLEELERITSWDRLRGEVHEDLWNIVDQITDGDPLTWLTGHIDVPGPSGRTIRVPSLPVLHDRVSKTLDLVTGEGHQGIRDVVRLAKEKFPLDGFLQELATVDEIPELKALTEQRLNGFVERLMGPAFQQLRESNAGEAVKQLNGVLNKVDQFQKTFYDKLKETANQSMSFSLHAEYSRATSREVLVDLLINLGTDEGRTLMREAGQGNFARVLTNYRSDVVRVREGRLTSKRVRSGALSINVVGWHGGWHYQGLSKVIVSSEQQITTSETGTLNVYTTLDLQNEKARVRNEERVYTNFLLRFIGHSGSAIRDAEFDEGTRAYLIDAISSMSAKYQLLFANEAANEADLDFYLGFGAEMGLKGATKLKGILPSHGTGKKKTYGEISADYRVRFTETALRRPFLAPEPFDDSRQQAVRDVMRKIVLANYAKVGTNFLDVARCYNTPGIYAGWKESTAKNVSKFIGGMGNRSFDAVTPSPLSGTQGSKSVTLARNERMMLQRLYEVEDRMVAGLTTLFDLIQSQARFAPHKFEGALEDIGVALKMYDDIDEGTNTVFALLDHLVGLRTPPDEARTSTLELQSDVALPDPEKPGETKTVNVTKVLVSGAEGLAE